MLMFGDGWGKLGRQTFRHARQLTVGLAVDGQWADSGLQRTRRRCFGGSAGTTQQKGSAQAQAQAQAQARDKMRMTMGLTGTLRLTVAVTVTVTVQSTDWHLNKGIEIAAMQKCRN